MSNMLLITAKRLSKSNATKRNNFKFSFLTFYQEESALFFVAFQQSLYQNAIPQKEISLTQGSCGTRNREITSNKRSSNKLRMKALVGWNTFYQVPEMINLKIFFTKIKNDMDKEDKIA